MDIFDIIHTVVETVAETIVAAAALLDYIRNEKTARPTKISGLFTNHRRTTVTGGPFNSNSISHCYKGFIVTMRTGQYGTKPIMNALCIYIVPGFWVILFLNIQFIHRFISGFIHNGSESVISA
ncbi:MAG: hypothetical protein E7188_01400 [Erysipelotrichaceae bacterium]|nr:hypothetical protein [Erysipelotrichaceae bacterium]